MQPDWDNWLERLYNLRRDKCGSHERPHKPVLLLSIMDLLDRGLIGENKVALSEDLVRTFKRYFEVVRQGDDQPTIQNPFFHLSGDRFWDLVPADGETTIYKPGATSGAPSVAELRRRVGYGRFDERFWALLSQPVSRHQLREALIAPCPDRQHREGVWKISRRLEERKEGQRDLVALAGKPVIPPGDEKFYPAIEGLRWRENQLTTSY
jgi:putative restriction endonuclease